MFKLEFEPEIAQRIIDRIVARSPLSDVTPGSVLAQTAHAVARGIEKANLSAASLIELFSIFRATGADLDARAAEVMPAGLARRAASRAVGTLRWTRDTATASAVVIPAGTIVAQPNSNPQISYITTAPGEIPAAGTQSVRTDGPGGDIPARAVAYGSAGNCAAGAATKQVPAIPGTNAVTNPTPFAGGVDVEGDDALRQRIVEHTSTLARCTEAALEARARDAEVDGVRVVLSKFMIDPFTPARGAVYIDDGSGSAESFSVTPAAETIVASATGGESRFQLDRWPLRGAAWTVRRNGAALAAGVDYILIPSDGLIVLSPTVFPVGLTAGDSLTIDPYQFYTGLVAEAQRLINGDPADPIGTPPYRGAGVFIRVLTPTVRWMTVACSISVEDGFVLPDVQAAAEAVISRYINSLGIGDDVILTELIYVVQDIAGVYDVAFADPVGNTPIGDTEIARIASNNIEVS